MFHGEICVSQANFVILNLLEGPALFAQQAFMLSVHFNMDVIRRKNLITKLINMAKLWKL